MISELYEKVKSYKKVLYITTGISSVLIGFTTIGYLVKKNYLVLPNN